MGEEQAITRIATVDQDLHDIEGSIDYVRMKVDRNPWLLTTDGRLVKSDKVVSMWLRTDEDGELV